MLRFNYLTHLATTIYLYTEFSRPTSMCIMAFINTQMYNMCHTANAAHYYGHHNRFVYTKMHADIDHFPFSTLVREYWGYNLSDYRLHRLSCIALCQLTGDSLTETENRFMYDYDNMRNKN